VSYFNFFYGRETEENHYEFHELSLHFSGSALNFSVNLGHYPISGFSVLRKSDE